MSIPSTTQKFCIAAAMGAAALLHVCETQAVILYRSPTRNTTAPTGTLANSGWQYQGQFGAFLGTPIAPQYFITAQHIGGAPSITYQGTTYNIDGSFNGVGYVNGPGSDLRIWKIQGTFPSAAPLWDPAVDGGEIGQMLVVFGRGTARGASVYGRFAGPPRDGSDPKPIPGPGGNVKPRDMELKGWQWGAFDSVQAWGTNNVDGLFNGGPFGPLLGFDFDRVGLFDESALSAGDSGGGVFLRSPGGAWKLAGINFAVDGPWRTSLDRPAFDASIFDGGGLYVSDPPQFLADQTFDLPGRSYSTQTSAHLAWIRGIISANSSVPEPASAALALLFAGAATLRRHRRAS